MMWKKIPGFDNYEVSDVGEVRSIDRVEIYRWRGKEYRRPKRGVLLKQTLNNTNGYLHVHLGRDAIYPIHRLVAWAFLGEQLPGIVVRHKDGNKLNNSAINLAYGTTFDNYEDAVSHGSMPVGEKHYNAVLTESVVLSIRKRCNDGESAADVARSLGLKYPTVLAVKNRKTWRWIDENQKHQAVK